MTKEKTSSVEETLDFSLFLSLFFCSNILPKKLMYSTSKITMSPGIPDLREEINVRFFKIEENMPSSGSM